MLSALVAESADFLVVGAYALAAHSIPRATGDLDCWIRRTPENADRVFRALAAFGAPLDQISRDDLLDPDRILQLGVAPSRIDIMTSIDGVEFDEAWPNRLVVSIEGVSVPVIGREDLIRNKRAAARPRDLADVAYLEAQRGKRPAKRKSKE
jgi:hypothetical protein